MNHELLQDRLLDLACGELSPREAREVEEHAAGCEACRAELARMRDTRRLMATLPQEPAPEAGERILLAAAREAVRARAPRRTLPRWLLSATVAAASLAIVAGVSYRLIATGPRSLGREDPNALMGDSPYAQPRASELGKEEAPRRFAAPPVEDQRAAAKAETPSTPRRAGARPPPAAPPAQMRELAEPRAAAPSPPPPTGPPETNAASPQDRSSSPPARAGGEGEQDSAFAAESAPAPAPESPDARAAGPASAPRASRGAAKAAAPAPERFAVRAEGALRGEIRTFPGCEEESWRKVELDPDGRVVKYVREGRIAGRRVRIDHAYGPDGTLVSASARDVERGEPLDPRSLGVALPERAEEAGPDAPPRCGR
jgi:ribonuclease E